MTIADDIAERQARRDTEKLLDELEALHVRRMVGGVVVLEAVDHTPFEIWHEVPGAVCPVCARIKAIQEMRRDTAEDKHERVKAKLSKLQVSGLEVDVVVRLHEKLDRITLQERPP